MQNVYNASSDQPRQKEGIEKNKVDQAFLFLNCDTVALLWDRIHTNTGVKDSVQN